VNEQIKAIGRQAGFVFIEDGVYGDRWYSSKCGMDASEFEKLAELIVLECARVVKASSPNGMIGVNAIRIHFGVEP
jgi:hypothetical protein